MAKVKVGQVTAQERDEIRLLFERRNGLTELAAVVSSPDDALYERLVADMGTTTSRFRDWWQQKAEQYGWVTAPDGHWEINFETCEIYLVRPE